MEHEILLLLLQKISKGDRHAFTSLYEKTSGQLFAVALKMLRNKEAAEEALQEAYIKIWHKADYYQEGQGTVLTWMVSIVRYRALDTLRHNKVRSEQSYEDLLAQSSDSILLSDTRDENVDSAQSSNTSDAVKPHKIETCMGELSLQQRQAIHLAYHNGFTHSEVTKHLNSPLGTIKVPSNEA